MKIARLTGSAYRIPTDCPEAAGTCAWDATTLVLVEAVADSGARGLGFSYTAGAAAGLVRNLLAPAVCGRPVPNVRAAWAALVRAVRNVGRPGVAATAIAAVASALWDLHARAAGQPLFRLLGAARDAVPIYGSGSFSSYSVAELAEQLAGWVAQGIPRVKMKVGKDAGTRPDEDLARVAAARQVIGPPAALFVDANGAYTPRQAVDHARRFAEHGVSYFEEPVPMAEHVHLAFVCAPAPMAGAAGEYGYSPADFRDLLQGRAGTPAIEILQADVTRCLGITGFLEAAALAHSCGVPFSGPTAPAIHAPVGGAVPQISRVEYFYDRVRIERLLFDGVPEPGQGELRPDPARPGLGLHCKRADAEQWRISA